jgi:hypothetical protein
MRTLPFLVLACSVVVVPAADASALRFVDLRAQGGVTVDDGPTANLTLMAGDIGNKNRHVITMDADLGIVLGLRGQVADVTAERDDGLGDLDLTLGGGTLLGGLGFYLGERSHAELVFGWAQGVGTTTGSHPWDERDTRFTQYLGELGWYYTWNVAVQVGVTVGYSVVKVKHDDPVAGRIKAEADGVDAGIALGVRF